MSEGNLDLLIPAIFKTIRDCGCEPTYNEHGPLVNVSGELKTIDTEKILRLAASDKSSEIMDYIQRLCTVEIH